jgi:HSP20 family molecular chaperone IbpA
VENMNLITRDSLFDALFDNFNENKKLGGIMKADIYEKDDKYVIEMDIPGFKKEEVNVDYEEGYVTVTAKKEQEKNDENKNFIKRERVYGEYTRSFYVGNIKEEDIKAKFEDGMLKLKFPKEDQKENIKQIPIE